MKIRILFFLAFFQWIQSGNVFAQINFSTILVPPGCANANTGKIEVIPSGSTGPFTITLIKGGANQGPAERLVTSEGAYTFTGLGAGGYTVIVSGADPSCPQVRKRVQLSNPPDFFGSVYAMDSTCGPCDVNLIADFQPSGDFSYTWSTNQTNRKITGMCDGNYSVTVTQLSTGCQKPFSVTAFNEVPSLSINLPGTLCAEESNTFSFNASSTSTGPCFAVNPDSIVWDFGDNTGSFDESPSHSYSFPGTYTIVLTTNGGLSATETITVNPTTLSFSSNSDCGEPRSFSFSPMVSCYSGSDYQWDFGDPNSPSNTSTDQNPTHVFSSVGDFSVTLTVGNQTVSGTVTVVDNFNLTPQIFADLSSCTSFPFRRSFSSNVQCAQTYNWNFGDPASGAFNTSTGSAPVHNFSGPGSYQVTLTTNPGLSSEISTSLMVVVDNPVSLVQSPDRVLTNPGDSVTIGPPAESGFQFSWQDGSSTTPRKVYQPGMYVVFKRNPGNPNACLATDTILVNYCGQFVLGHKEELDKKNVSVFPNPVSRRFFVSGVAMAGFAVVNAQGQEVLSGNQGDFPDGIPTSGFSAGLYFFHWTSEDHRSGRLKFLIHNE